MPKIFWKHQPNLLKAIVGGLLKKGSSIQVVIFDIELDDWLIINEGRDEVKMHFMT